MAKVATVVDDTLCPPEFGTIADGQFLKRVGTQIVGSAGSGGVAWGGITGTLSAQTDLQTALDGKQASGSYATAAQGALADTALQSIANGSVTLAKMADMATASLIYRKTAATGVPEVNTLATLKTDLTLVKADVGLGSVDNTTDAGKPVSTAQQTALDLKANLVSPTLTGTPAIAAATGTSLVLTGAMTGVGGTHTAITGLGIRSTGTGAFDLKFANTENLTVADKTLTIALGDADRTLTLGASPSVSGSNTGDQTTIAGITGTIAQFNTACTDADFATGGGTATGSNTGDQTISDATISTTDITTNDSSSVKHGFLKKLDGLTTTFLRGDGAWAAPTASAAWGSITGTLSNQTDLQTALDAKAPLVSPSFTTPVLGVASSTSLATSAAIPLLLTNAQLVNVSLTAQTIGATTLTIPDFAGVVDEFTFKTKAQTMSNKTFVAPVLGTPASGTLTSCTFPTLNQNTTGSAALLTTARTINGTSFDGTANINAVPTSTSGIGASPMSSSTQQITHSLGRTPVKVRIYGLGNKQSSTSASNDLTSFGMWCASGNTCINRIQGASAGQASSTTFAIKVGSGASAFCTGVIGNVGATTFDIVWTESGTSDTTPVYLWEAE